jgi:hypothetical protein
VARSAGSFAPSRTAGAVRRVLVVSAVAAAVVAGSAAGASAAPKSSVDPSLSTVTSTTTITGVTVAGPSKGRMWA